MFFHFTFEPFWNFLAVDLTAWCFLLYCFEHSFWRQIAHKKLGSINGT